MKAFTLVIKLENDAFYEDPNHEIIRILEHVAELLHADEIAPGMVIKLYDCNGNGCGFARAIKGE